MERKALKDFTFSDGTFIPKGTNIAALVRPVHLDEKIYEDPLSFKPFRFAEAREGANDARDAVKNQLVTTSLQYLLFGHGKHAWSVPRTFEHLLLEIPFHGRVSVEWYVDFIDSPGRFFAANELKCMMGYILLNYDIKWSNHDFLEGGYAPPNEVLGVTTRPDENAIIMFRRRV